jgi:hypothetical protein
MNDLAETELHPMGVVFEPKTPTLAQIRQFQTILSQFEQIPNEPKHYFADGQYCRELFIQAGAYVVGKLHRHSHMAMLIQGEATVWTDEGMVRMKAPHVWVSKAGAKRALFTHSDCIFVTTHVTTETDLEKIEEYVIIPETDLIEDLS